MRVMMTVSICDIIKMILRKASRGLVITNLFSWHSELEGARGEEEEVVLVFFLYLVCSSSSSPRGARRTRLWMMMVQIPALYI